MECEPIMGAIAPLEIIDLWSTYVDLRIISSVLLVLFLLFLSALISGSEVAFFSLSHKDILQLGESHSKSDQRIKKLLTQPNHLLSTILISNNLINIAIAIISGNIIAEMLPNHAKNTSFLITILVITPLLVLFGENIPKIYANEHNIQLAKKMALPLSFLKKLLHLPNTLLSISTNVIENKLKKYPTKLKLDELDTAINLTAQNAQNATQEIDLLKGVIHFSHITVNQILRSRVDVVCINETDSFEQVLKIVQDSGYSRIPVYRERIDTIIGVLYAKDLIAHLDKPSYFAWKQLLRKPFFIPEAKKINDLLKEIQQNRTHIAIVVDEYGGMSGIVTLEDIIEEVVGEIKDEHDDLEASYYKVNKHTFVFDGKTSINDVCKVLHTDVAVFDSLKGESDSIAGLILETTGRMPTLGDTIQVAHLELEVLSMSAYRIEKVKVKTPR